MKLHLIFVSLLLFCGCVRNVDKRELKIVLNNDEGVLLNQHCKELAALGDVVSLIQLINQKTEVLLDALEKVENDDDVDELVALSEEIRTLIAQSKSMLDPKFITPRWNYEIHWQIDREDFSGLIGTRFRNGFRITDVEPVMASVMGDQRDELLKQLEISKTNQKVEAFFKGKGSSLEICQLGKTRVLTIDVHYKNVINKNKRRFNLMTR